MNPTCSVLLGSVLFVGCSGTTARPAQVDSEPLPAMEPLSFGEGLHYHPPELDMDHLYPPAKTLEWMQLSTVEGTRYLGGKVVVDRILRHDAQGMYGVDVRLKNRGEDPLLLETRLVFLSREGKKLLGMGDEWDAGQRVDWKRIALEPFGLRSISGGAAVQGAVGFDLRVREIGSDSDGKPDYGEVNTELDALRRALEEE